MEHYLIMIFFSSFILSASGFTPVTFWESMEWKRNASTIDFQNDPSIQKAKTNFDRFCDRNKALPTVNYDLPPKIYSIPPILHFIWLGSPLPEKGRQTIKSWLDHHPGWEWKLWTDEEVNQFPWTDDHLRSVFEQADSWAEKADILRLDILYQWGGIYSDIDALCLQPFHDLIVQDITFFSCFELNYASSHYGEAFYVGTAVIGAAKGSNVLKYCLVHSKTQKEAPDLNLLKRTGPGLVSKACQASFHLPQEHILILPCSYLYPLPWKLRNENDAGFIGLESLAIHLWNNSWMKK